MASFLAQGEEGAVMAVGRGWAGLGGATVVVLWGVLRRLMAMAKQAGSREANELWLAFLHKVKRGR